MATQSLREHLSIANTVSSHRKTIYLHTLEDPFPDPAALDAIVRYLTVFFCLTVRITHTRWQCMRLQTRPGCSGFGDFQLSMDDLLVWLKHHVPEDAYCIVAVTGIDLFLPTSAPGKYIPGRSHYTQRHGAFSIARLGSEVDTYFQPCSQGLHLRRCLKLSSHEVAHTFGLKHCIKPTCRMAGTTSLEHHDETSLFFCNMCEQKLQKLLRWSRHDCQHRARRVAQCLRGLGIEEFDDEARYLESIAGDCQQEKMAWSDRIGRDLPSLPCITQKMS
eukprot:TRINITY_DN68778_c0_g1_i1.p1 TRINITY_DN68778_c0_g1~~TRINITY_DN68778_c0_g1_i1.p1  ORF type:complete len:275 (+),score=16.72 TRINITY_DN68778_c0_g1_i1:81-905(+)